MKSLNLPHPREAYEKNLRDDKDTIPRLFDAHGFMILSNGLEAVMGGALRSHRDRPASLLWRLEQTPLRWNHLSGDDLR